METETPLLDTDWLVASALAIISLSLSAILPIILPGLFSAIIACAREKRKDQKLSPHWVCWLGVSFGALLPLLSWSINKGIELDYSSLIYSLNLLIVFAAYPLGKWLERKIISEI